MMRIESHRIVGDETVDVTQRTNLSGPIIRPEIVVIHYGVTSTLEALTAAQAARGYWAHLSIDGSAETGHRLYQALPFNMRGSHAGRSSYRGRQACNGFSVGIEIANPGPLIRDSAGVLRTVYGQAWPEDDAIEGQHSGLPRGHKWKHWARYSDQEIDLCVELCCLLRDEYGITDVVGHDEIAPGRKFDPGPAFPMTWLREKVFG